MSSRARRGTSHMFARVYDWNAVLVTVRSLGVCAPRDDRDIRAREILRATPLVLSLEPANALRSFANAHSRNGLAREKR
jgi:hypothetical protein